MKYIYTLVFLLPRHHYQNIFARFCLMRRSSFLQLSTKQKRLCVYQPCFVIVPLVFPTRFQRLIKTLSCRKDGEHVYSNYSTSLTNCMFYCASSRLKPSLPETYFQPLVISSYPVPYSKLKHLLHIYLFFKFSSHWWCWCIFCRYFFRS